MAKSLDLDVLWGAYYTYYNRDTEVYELFRLLDFNKDAFHYALFAEDFKTRPDASEITALKPFIAHVPQAVGALLKMEALELTAKAPLTDEALSGYGHYLHLHDAEDAFIDTMFSNLKAYSQQTPLKVRLETDDEDEVTVIVIGHEPE